MRGIDRHRICFFVFAGSKKCTRNSPDCPLCLWVQKNAPATVLIAYGVCGFKKVPISVERVLCLRVQKNAPAMVLNVVILSVAKDLLPVNSKDNVTNLVIARRALPDMAISFAQCVMLSSAKHLLAGRLRGDSSLHLE